jgi:hypothetical protein
MTAETTNRPKRPRAKAGDILRIDLGDGKYAMAQVLIAKISLYLVVFDRVVDVDFSPARIGELGPLLIGETTSVLVRSGDWAVVGKSPVPADYPRPYAVVNNASGLVVHDFDRNVVREASAKDARFYGYRCSASSQAVVAEARACLGLDPPQEGFEYLRFENVKRRSRPTPDAPSV